MMKYILFFCGVVFALSCQSQSKFSLDAKTFSEKISSTDHAVVLDVRTPGEYKEGYINKAINIDYNDAGFEDRINKLEKNLPYFVYCLSGGRSGSAASYMRERGFKQVYELKGGMMAWRNNQMPVATSQTNMLTDKISTEEYEKIINTMPVVLIDFYAPWCGPCKKIQPILEELEKEYAGKAYILRINIDENKQLQRRMGIDEIPFFKRYVNGKENGNYIGQMDRKSLVRVLDEYLEVKK
jgi:thioredoxin 1